jgi:hypothetical protein
VAIHRLQPERQDRARRNTALDRGDLVAQMLEDGGLLVSVRAAWLMGGKSRNQNLGEP